jgi:methylphosphotriester-DNA--protein-cysteine methyltransferase
MKGRFRNACIRCASRIGRRERVKFAEENNASLESGGRPCLEN